jgi:hypothetical protein
MKKIKILNGVFTGLFAALMFLSAVPDIFTAADAVKGMHTDLGYPLYFVPFIGVLKALGVFAILFPGFSKIKEWAYAGLCFDLVGATYSIIASGHPANAVFMILPLTLAILSYIFYHKKQAAKKQVHPGAQQNLYENDILKTAVA